MITFYEILSNKLKMRDKNTQFVNNTPQIINRNAFPSKNIATLVLNRQNINVDEDDGNSGDIPWILVNATGPPQAEV